MLLKKYRIIRNTTYKRIRIHQYPGDDNMCRYCVFNIFHCNNKCKIANFDGLLYNAKYSIVYVIEKV